MIPIVVGILGTFIKGLKKNEEIRNQEKSRPSRQHHFLDWLESLGETCCSSSSSQRSTNASVKKSQK